MADLSKFKRKSSLGAPPPPSEASGNLDAPEIAPVFREEPAVTLTMPQPVTPTRSVPVQGRGGEAKQDGRSARRTGRTHQFATRVTEAYDEQLRRVAARDGLLLAELLELSLEAYEAVQRKKST